MKKFVCTVCGYVYEGEAAPEKCPVCGVGADKFTEVKEGEREWAAEHVAVSYTHLHGQSHHPAYAQRPFPDHRLFPAELFRSY